MRLVPHGGGGEVFPCAPDVRALTLDESERAGQEEPAAKDDESRALYPNGTQACEREAGQKRIRRGDDDQVSLAPDRFGQDVTRDEGKRDGQQREEGEEQERVSTFAGITSDSFDFIVLFRRVFSLRNLVSSPLEHLQEQSDDRQADEK